MHPYPIGAQLAALVRQMRTACIRYAEAVEEFRKEFIVTVLRDVNGNATKAARVLGMHRNTLARTLRDLNLDARALRKARLRLTHVAAKEGRGRSR